MGKESSIDSMLSAANVHNQIMRLIVLQKSADVSSYLPNMHNSKHTIIVKSVLTVISRVPFVVALLRSHHSLPLVDECPRRRAHLAGVLAERVHGAANPRLLQDLRRHIQVKQFVDAF